MAIETYAPEIKDGQDRKRIAVIRKGIKVATDKGIERPTDTDAFHPNFADDYIGKIAQVVWADVFGSPSPKTMRGLYAISDEWDDDITFYRSLQDWRGESQIRRCNGTHVEKVANFVVGIDKFGSQRYGADGTKEEWFVCQRHPDAISCFDEKTKKGCKFTGRLRLRSPELMDAMIEWLSAMQANGQHLDWIIPDGYLEFFTGALSDDTSIRRSLKSIATTYATAYRKPMSSLPLMMYREENIVAERKMQTLRLAFDLQEARAQGLVELVVPVSNPQPLRGAFDMNDSIDAQRYSYSATLVESGHIDPQTGEETIGYSRDDEIDEKFRQLSEGGKVKSGAIEIPEGGFGQWASEWAQRYVYDVEPLVFLDQLRNHLGNNWETGEMTKRVLEHFDTLPEFHLAIARFVSEKGITLWADEVRVRNEGTAWRYYLNCEIFNPKLYTRQAFVDAGFGRERVVVTDGTAKGEKDFVDARIERIEGSIKLTEVFQDLKCGGCTFTAQFKVADNGKVRVDATDMKFIEDEIPF